MRRRKKYDWRTFWLFVLLSTFIGNRRYKGDRSHLKGAGGFFVDLLCILCLTPLAVMLVNHYEKCDMKRSAKIMARNSSSAQSQRTSSTNPSRQSATAHEKDREKSSTTRSSTKAKQAAPRKEQSSVATTVAQMPKDGRDTIHAPVHTMPTAEERRRELAWQAQQAAMELEKQQIKATEESRKAESDRKRREELRLAAADVISRLSEQVPDSAITNESSLESGDSVPIGGIYCGRIYVSRLMDFDDAEQAFCVPVPGENLQYSICWGSIPDSLRGILKDYCAAGGSIVAMTEKNWINEAEYKLWVSLYLQ